MRTFSALATVALVALSLAPIAHAAADNTPPIANPTQIIDNITVEEMAQIVREIGGQNVEIREANGKKGVTFMDGPVPFNIAPVFCELRPGKCLALAIIVLVDNTELKFTLETLNSANKQTSLLTFFTEANNKWVAGRVDVVDGGVTRKNLAMHLALTVVEFHEAMKRLQSQLTAGVNQPFPYQRVAYSRGQFRALAASPDYVARVGESLAQSYRQRFHRR